MATKLPKLPDVQRLSGSIVRVMGGNSNKFTLQGTNTYILGTNPSSLVLIDTAQGFSAWRHNLSNHLSSLSTPSKVKTCLLTHWHHDHIAGVPDLLSISREASIHKGLGGSYDPDGKLKGITVNEIKEGDVFSDDAGFEIQALHCPGHAKDHMAFVVTRSTFEDEIGCMFTGDNVLGHGTAVFEDLAVYLASLDKMKERVMTEADKKRNKDAVGGDSSSSLKAYPAHGDVIQDAKAKIEEYITHRKMREDEALNVLRFGTAKKPEIGGKEVTSGKSWKSMDMVKVIYAEVPAHLHEPAERGLLMVLEKLMGDGRVNKEDGKWRISEKATL